MRCLATLWLRQFDCQLAGALQIQLKRMTVESPRSLPQAKNRLAPLLLKVLYAQR
jgi:hypothetical protein